jgi:hypothetical protein
VMASWVTLAFIAYATVAPISGRPEIDTGEFWTSLRISTTTSLLRC